MRYGMMMILAMVWALPTNTQASGGTTGGKVCMRNGEVLASRVPRKTEAEHKTACEAAGGSWGVKPAVEAPVMAADPERAPVVEEQEAPEQSSGGGGGW